MQHARNARNLPNIAPDDAEYIRRLVEARAQYEVEDAPAMLVLYFESSSRGRPHAVPGKRVHQDHVAPSHKATIAWHIFLLTSKGP